MCQNGIIQKTFLDPKYLICPDIKLNTQQFFIKVQLLLLSQQLDLHL